MRRRGGVSTVEPRAVVAKGIVMVAALVTSTVLASPRAAPPRSAANLSRAVAAYASMQRFFAGSQAYNDAYPASGPSSAWSFSQALAATLSLAATSPAYVADVRSELAALDLYWQPAGYLSFPAPPVGTGGSQYLDDNEWIAQDLVRAYGLLHDPRLLARAQQVLALVTAAWDRNGGDACTGGVFWTHDPSNADRNAVSTANGAVLALDLYQQTGDRHQLHWAQTMYGWVRRCLSAPDGLYADHLDPSGAVDRHEWSYNQGAMVAAAVGLYEATGRRAYLAQAQALAAAALARFEADGFADDPACFVAIFFRDLKRLDEAAPDPGYRAAAQRYADDRWAAAGEGPASTLLDQAAVVDLYAQLAA